MKNFKELNIEEIPEVVKIKSQIAELTNKIKSLNSGRIDYGMEISKAEGILKDLKIKHAIGEAELKQVKDQQSLLNDLINKQQKAKEDYRDEIEILNAANDTLQARLAAEIANAEEKNIEHLREYLHSLKVNSESKINEVLAITKEICQAEIELSRREKTETIYHSIFFPKVSEALAVVHVVTKAERKEKDYELHKPFARNLFYNSI